MLKYYDIIDKLSDSEKIRMLCDVKCLSDKHYRALGIPELSITALEDYCEDEYPGMAALANTWDTTLMYRVAEELFKKASESKMGLIKVPAPRIKVNPYRHAISEDPVLASSMSGACINAAAKAEVPVALSSFGLYKDDPEWLDDAPDQRFIRELIVKPYIDATRGKKCAAILTKEDLSTRAYASVNSSLMDMVAAGEVAKGATAVCAQVSAENTVAHLIKGGLCFEGSVIAVESALSKYNKLAKDVARGRVTGEELNAEVAKGKAISPEMLDSAVDRMLDFIFTVKRKPNINTVAADTTLAQKAAEKATVLLKNEHGVLPFKKQAKIGMIGDVGLVAEENCNALIPALQTLLTKEGMTCVGVQRGYDLSKERSEELVEDAVRLAKECDVVLLFLGAPEMSLKKSHKTGKLSIPANQQELLDALDEYRQKVVAVLPAEYTQDICIPEHCSGILMAPLKVRCAPMALSNILLGKKNPGGRLANTVYVNTEECYVKYKTRREQQGLGVGGFVGYRYYDMTEEVSGFPFGHGLGYGNVTYSSMTVEDAKVKVEIKNTGKNVAYEVVQVYMGKIASSVLRVQKELCGFACAELKPGEKRTLEIPIRIPSVYSEAKSEYVVEAGEYGVYVGASVMDIRLSDTVKIEGTTLEPDNKRMSDYVHSVTNIFSDNYKLEAKIKAMKKSVFNFIAGGIALVLAIVLKLFCLSQHLEIAFFDWFAIALALTGVAFFVVEAIRRNRIRNEEQHTIDKMNAEAFKGAEQIPVYGAQSMFVEEFDTAEKTTEAEINDQVEGVESEYLQYIDKEQNFERAAAEFETYAAQRGCKFRADVTKKVFAALASSRLIVLEGMSDAELMTLMKMLCGYFETDLFIDRANELYHDGDSVLFKTDEQGYKTKTNVHLALDSARNARHHVHLAVLSNVQCDALPAYFTPYVNYVKNPASNNHVVMLNERNLETSYYIPSNVWFILSLAKEERADHLPGFISEIATVNHFDFDNYTVSESPSDVRKFSYYQLDYLAERAANKLSVDEDTWKKIDHLEEYVSSITPFHIGNKLWLCLERYSYVYLACGGEKAVSVDEAIAAKLMVPIISKLDGQLKAEEQSLGETVESILGEDRAEACKRIIRACTDRKA